MARAPSPPRPDGRTESPGRDRAATESAGPPPARPQRPPRPPALRLFIALWPDADTRVALRSAQAAWQWPPRARPVAVERLHLTLHFLGALPPQRLAELQAALAPPGGRFDAFTLHWGPAALWPHGLAVLLPVPPAAADRGEDDAARHGLRRLHDLHARLGAVLRRLGLPVETRAFRPHVTLARDAAGAVPLPAPADAAAPFAWPVRGYALVQSLAPAPGGYRVLQHYP